MLVRCLGIEQLLPHLQSKPFATHCVRAKAPQIDMALLIM